MHLGTITAMRNIPAKADMLSITKSVTKNVAVKSDQEIGASEIGLGAFGAW